MSDEIQRLLGKLEAKVESLTGRMGRVEKAFVAVGAAAIGVVIAVLLKQAGLM